MAQKEDKAEALVLSFILEQNRPVNAQNVADAMQKHGIKKTAIQKALDSLAGAGPTGPAVTVGAEGAEVAGPAGRGCGAQVSYKDYGKQRIYLARQDVLDVPSAAELEAMRERVAALQGEAMQLREQCSSLEKDRSSLESSLTMEQLQQQTQELTAENGALQEKLQQLLRDTTSTVSSEERQNLTARYERYVGLWRKRKRVFQSLWDAVTDNFPRDLREFKDELGIEMDEEAGCSLTDHDSAADSGTPHQQGRRASLAGAKRKAGPQAGSMSATAKGGADSAPAKQVVKKTAAPVPRPRKK